MAAKRGRTHQTYWSNFFKVSTQVNTPSRLSIFNPRWRLGWLLFMPRRVRAVQGALQPSSFRWTPPSWIHSPGNHRAGSVRICVFGFIHCARRSRMETGRWFRSNLLSFRIVAVARNGGSRRPLASSPIMMDHSCLAMTRARSMGRE